MWMRDANTIEPLNLAGRSIGGVMHQGESELRVAMTGERLQLVELRLNEGFYHPRHNHPDHESMGYVISGRLEMGIGDEEFVLTPGCAWRHGVGVYHWTRALEDTLAVEIHSPARPEFSE